MSLPVPNLDDKTFDQLVAEARLLIPRYSQQWTDHNLHDPGITFMELLAWLSEMQIYSLNRVTESHYLKFLRLLNIRPQPPKSAQVPVTFTILQGNDALLVEKGTQVAARNSTLTDDIIFEIEEDIWVSPQERKEILTDDGFGFIRNTDANDHDGLFYYAFGERPQKENALYLGFSSLFPGKEIKIWINLYEQDLKPKPVQYEPDFELLPSAVLDWEYWNGNKWKPLKIINNDTINLAQSGRITFLGPADARDMILHPIEQSLYWIRCQIIESDYEIPPRIDSLLLNTVMATHCQTQCKDVPEVLGSSNGLPHQVFTLSHIPVIAGSELIEVQETDGTWQHWSRVDDFDNSDSEDIHYTINLTNGEIKFGDGIHGRIPPKDGTIQAVNYQTGGGEAGNIDAQKINRVVTAGISTVTLTNNTPATGGQQPESKDDAIALAQQDLRKRYRAVTGADYESLALATPGIRVARAKALPLFHPCYPGYKVPGAVTVVVVPYTIPESKIETPKPGKNFCRMVYNHLKRFRLLTTNLFVIAPQYVQISVKTKVRIKAKKDPVRVKNEIDKKLKEFLNPVHGGPERNGWPFGRDVVKSEVYQVINDVPGVDYVNSLSLTIDKGCAKALCDNIKIPDNAIVYSGVHEILIA